MFLFRFLLCEWGPTAAPKVCDPPPPQTTHRNFTALTWQSWILDRANPICLYLLLPTYRAAKSVEQIMYFYSSLLI
jgi:hypothetical protein